MKGKFSQLDDRLLLLGIERYGTKNFEKIK